ncbi:MAG TPA: hypothetical protein VGM92_15665 [Candidatus Kapabacteria bacterium]|jgi:hypothetical protein
MFMRPEKERILSRILLGLALILVAMQMRSLTIFPEANSFRWFGDETWLMSEAKQQVLTGTVTYPLSIGSTLEHGKGLVLSMTWLSSLLYGVPIALLHFDPVSIGRIVTGILSITLLITLYRSSRLLGAGPLSAAAAVLLLCSARSFFFSSHSARSDILAGLVVLLFVTFCIRADSGRRRRATGWWFGYGAMILFLCISSSIHLLTLLGPISIYFLWRLGAFTNAKNVLAAFAGGVSVLLLFVVIYYATTGNLMLFSSSAQHMQFQDVLSSIPILRPFSRSVQVSNVIIRLKQLWAESPAIFIFPIVSIVAWKTVLSFKNTFVFALCIIFLSWLLLEGAEVNYLIHILPLLFLGCALGLSAATRRWEQITNIALFLFSLFFFIFGIRDTIAAKNTASRIDDANAAAVHSIEKAIASHWQINAKPRVVSEPLTLERLSRDTNLETMTDHFISFPTLSASYDSLFSREHIDFIVLYNSPTYPKNRMRDDPFYQAVEQDGALIGSYIGTSGDMGRNYFDRSDWQDTILLFQFRHGHE